MTSSQLRSPNQRKHPLLRPSFAALSKRAPAHYFFSQHSVCFYHMTCHNLKIFIYIYIDFMFYPLHCELCGCWFLGVFVLHVSPAPHSPGNIVSTQNSTVRIIFIEHLLGAGCSSKLFMCIISFNPHRVSLLTLDSEGGYDYALRGPFTYHWFFSFPVLQLHCLPFKHVFFTRSATKLFFVYLFLIICLLIIYAYFYIIECTIYNIHIHKEIYSFSCEAGLFLLDKCQIILAMKQNQNRFMYQFKKKENEYSF